jgi:antitoxin (DNA-binding transcriptional repressor) of toxin-antitoxin stability system
MRDIGITEFRRRCLSLLKDLPEQRIVITKRGRPVIAYMRTLKR